MLYTTSRTYEALCAAAKDRGYIVRLGRLGQAWGLQVIVPAPAEKDGRAAGVLFPRLEMLDAEAEHLLRWVRGAA
jgi:hypothetical protein